MTAEGNGWYKYTFEKDSINLIFRPYNGSNWEGKTADLSRAVGEWWYLDGWLEYNPDDSVAPVIEEVTTSQTGTFTGDVIFSVAATDNQCLSNVEFYHL